MVTIITRLVNSCEDIILQLKIHQVKRSIIKSKSACLSINWYILVFVVSSMMMKAVNGFEKWCLCNGVYSCPAIADFVHLSNIEEEIEELLLCHFEEYWKYAYTTTSTICDVLVVIATISRNHHQLVYPWLVTKLIALTANVCCVLHNFMMSRKPTTLHLVVLDYVNMTSIKFDDVVYGLSLNKAIFDEIYM